MHCACLSWCTAVERRAQESLTVLGPQASVATQSVASQKNTGGNAITFKTRLTTWRIRVEVPVGEAFVGEAVRSTRHTIN
jgi:hypothetical protein